MGRKRKQPVETLPTVATIKDETTQDTLITIHSLADEYFEEAEDDQQFNEETNEDEEDEEGDKRIYEYVCARCDKSFPSMQEIQSHQCEKQNETIKSTSIKKRLKNRIPGVELLPYINPLKIKRQHYCYCCGEIDRFGHLKGEFECKECSKKFLLVEGLNSHMHNVHADTDEFACAECNIKCVNAEVFESHKNIHKKPFNCQKCGKLFTRKYHLDRHMSFTSCSDDTDRPELKCDVCNKTFTRLDNLREHLRAHLGQATKKREFHCDYCKKSFYGLSLLNIHIRTHTKERPFNCDFCPKAFPSSGALTKHRRSHTGERPYECGICKNRFSAKETLNRHFKTHTGEKKHVCNICGKAFIQATQLKSHMFYHTGENGYQCDICDKVFNRRIRFTEHKKFVHEGVEPPTCDHCQKIFYRKEDLMRHLETHNTEKQYFCDVCSKGFKSKASLNVHARIHKMESPTQCKECGRSFIRVDCLVRHMRSKHRDILQKVISEAETEKIIEAQKKMHGNEENSENEEETKEATGDEIEIILYKGNDENEGEETYELIHIDGVDEEENEEEEEEAVASTSSQKQEPQDPTPIIENLIVIRQVVPTNSITEPRNVTKYLPTVKPVVENEVKAEDPLKSAVKIIQHESNKKKPQEVSPKRQTESAGPAKRVTRANEKADASPPETANKESVKRGRKSESEKPSPKRFKKKKEISSEDEPTLFLPDNTFKEKLEELMKEITEDHILKRLGYGKKPIDDVLIAVLEECDREPVKKDNADFKGDDITRMRENAKILFSLCLEPEKLTFLLNNYTVDEIIYIILGISKEN